MKPKSLTYVFILLLNITALSYWIFLAEYHMSIPTRRRFYEQQNISTSNANNQSQNINILLCTDESDKLSMYTLINSILINIDNLHKNRLYFHIVILDKKEKVKNEIDSYFDMRYELKSIIDDNLTECIEFNDIASEIFHKDRNNRLNNPMNMARFCMPYLFPSVDIGIYLDVDMIALKSIHPLIDEFYTQNTYKIWSIMNTDITETQTGHQFLLEKRMKFVNDYIQNRLSKKYPSIITKSINFAGIKVMFNAGFLMFDLNEWRMNNYTQQSLDLFLLSKKYQRKFRVKPWSMVTQPIINMLFIVNGLEIGELDEEWNYLIKRHIDCKHPWNATKILDENVGILHWAGKNCKPWHGQGGNGVFNDLWKKYRPHK